MIFSDDLQVVANISHYQWRDFVNYKNKKVRSKQRTIKIVLKMLG